VKNTSPSVEARTAPVHAGGFFVARGGCSGSPCSNQRSGWKLGLGERTLCPATRTFLLYPLDTGEYRDFEVTNLISLFDNILVGVARRTSLPYSATIFSARPFCISMRV
jgi:hypothetical protein